MTDKAPSIDMKDLAGLLKILAEPNRLLILDLLMQGVQCNCEIGQALQIAPNLTSHHLHVLRRAGLVNTERDALDARWVYYSVNRKALDELYRSLKDFFDPARIQSRRPGCGPGSALLRDVEGTHNEK